MTREREMAELEGGREGDRKRIERSRRGREGRKGGEKRERGSRQR